MPGPLAIRSTVIMNNGMIQPNRTSRKFRSFREPKWRLEFVPRRKTLQQCIVFSEVLISARIVEAHSTLGYLKWQYGWEWQSAEKELRYAVELNPNYIEGHESLSCTWRGVDGSTKPSLNWRKCDISIQFTLSFISTRLVFTTISEITKDRWKQRGRPSLKIRVPGQLIAFSL
jgi:hypothetical protein